jgi:rare lipoprotein A
VPRAALAALVACTGCAATAPAGALDPVPAAPAVAAARGPEPVRELSVVASGGRAAGEVVPLATAHGEATYYADRFEGRFTASGSVFRQSGMLAAHRDYPFGTVLRVTNLTNGRTVEVRVVDRLPPARTDRAPRTVVDVSKGAAELLDFVRAGRVPVRVEVLEWGAEG